MVPDTLPLSDLDVGCRSTSTRGTEYRGRAPGKYTGSTDLSRILSPLRSSSHIQSCHNCFLVSRFGIDVAADWHQMESPCDLVSKSECTSLAAPAIQHLRVCLMRHSDVAKAPTSIVCSAVAMELVVAGFPPCGNDSEAHLTWKKKIIVRCLTALSSIRVELANHCSIGDILH